MAGENARATFSLELDSSQVSGAAQDAAGALSQLQAKIEGDEAALKSLQLAMRRLKGDAGSSRGEINALKSRIDAQKASIGASTREFLRLGGSFKTVKKQGGDLDDLIAKFPKLSQAMKVMGSASLIGAAGVAALVASLVAVTAATVIAIGAMARYALVAADARRSEGLRLEGLAKTRNLWLEMLGMSRKADSGAFLQQTVDRVAASSALARDQIVGLMDDFYRAGLRAGNLQSAVEAGAIALSTQGQAGLDQFKALALNAAMFGSSVKKVSDDVKARLGDLAKRQMLSLNVQFAKARENIATIFSGVKIEKFLEALHEVLSLFSQSTLAGQSLKKLVEALFNPFFDSVAKNQLAVKRFFQSAMIAGLKFMLFLLDVRDAWRMIFGKNVIDSMTLVKGAVLLGAFAVGVFAASLLLVGAAIAAVIAPIAMVGVFIYQYLVVPFENAYDAVVKKDWVGLGKAVITGIGEGIMIAIQAATSPVALMASLASKMAGAFTGKMMIKSPSRLMAMYSEEIPAGVGMGVDRGTPQAVNSMGRMTDAMKAEQVARLQPETMKIEPMAAKSVGQSGESAKGASSGTVVNLNVEKIDLSGSSDPKEQANNFLSQLRAALQGSAITIGVPA